MKTPPLLLSSFTPFPHSIAKLQKDETSIEGHELFPTIAGPTSVIIIIFLPALLRPLF